MHIGRYTFEEFFEIAREFHGYPAPGLLIGAYMVEAAKPCLPEGTLFEVLSETPKCLPDAVQLLTLCTFGNTRLRTLNLGRYALVLYDKFTGEGVRVFLDLAKLEDFPEIKAWYLKTKPKREQNSKALYGEIRRAGAACCTIRRVNVSPRVLEKKSMGAIAVCPVCREPYPASDGSICRGCLGETPYAELDTAMPENVCQDLRPTPVRDSVGKKTLHDMTRIVPGESKGVAFAAGQKITEGDICRLQQMGRMRVYTQDTAVSDAHWVHENEAVAAFARRMAGEGIVYDPHPREGKIDLYPAHDGVLSVNREILRAFNMLPDVMCATRRGDTFVTKDKAVAGTRALPLYISQDHLCRALETLHEPLLRILPVIPIKVGILVTGTEIASGMIQDRFAPIIQAKVHFFGCTVVGVEIAADTVPDITQGVQRLLSQGAGLIITTAGLSVDPDDVTLQGLFHAGLRNALRGAPVLPGAMTLLGEIDGVRVIGVPACALFHKTTSFDLLLPRVLAGQRIERSDLAELAEGGLCIQCASCTFPKCPFGK